MRSCLDALQLQLQVIPNEVLLTLYNRSSEWQLPHRTLKIVEFFSAFHQGWSSLIKHYNRDRVILVQESESGIYKDKKIHQCRKFETKTRNKTKLVNEKRKYSQKSRFRQDRFNCFAISTNISIESDKGQESQGRFTESLASFQKTV